MPEPILHKKIPFSSLLRHEIVAIACGKALLPRRRRLNVSCYLFIFSVSSACRPCIEALNLTETTPHKYTHFRGIFTVHCDIRVSVSDVTR